MDKPIRFPDTLDILKTVVEFCYGGGAMAPLLAARLLLQRLFLKWQTPIHVRQNKQHRNFIA